MGASSLCTFAYGSELAAWEAVFGALLVVPLLWCTTISAMWVLALLFGGKLEAARTWPL